MAGNQGLGKSDHLVNILIRNNGNVIINNILIRNIKILINLVGELNILVIEIVDINVRSLTLLN